MADRARDPAFVLDPDARKKLVEALIDYCEVKLDWELGNLDAVFLLEFVIDQVGPGLYNRALRDAQDWLLPRVNDLEADLWKAEPDVTRGR